jgi:hypothetical protein
LKDEDGIEMYQRLTQVHNLVSQIMDDFKEDFMKSSSYAVEHKLKTDSDVGMLAANELYLTEEEFNTINNMLGEIPGKHKDDGEERRVYSFLGGLARKFK